MSLIALEQLLTPLSPIPAGENLEYDPEFLELEQLALPKAERAVGDNVKAAEEPDWNEVIVRAKAMFLRSKDLRVAVHLTVALLKSHGLAGWTEGLGVVRGLLEHFWDDVHPQLDADDADDPTIRVNAAAAIGDPLAALGYLRHLPLIRSPRLGQFSLRDIRIANGVLKVAQADSGNLSTMVDIEACCMDCPEEQLSDAAASIQQALEHASKIDRLFGEKLGTQGPDLAHLVGDIRDLKLFLDAQMARRFPSLSKAGENGADGNSIGDERAPTSARGSIETQRDVINRLEELCGYYANNEPSSPIPLLLRRAQRLVGLSFTDLMKDLAPGGTSELSVIAGDTDES